MCGRKFVCPGIIRFMGSGGIGGISTGGLGFGMRCWISSKFGSA